MASKRYTNEDIINAVQDSKSIAEVCRRVGLSERGSNPITIKKKIKELNLDTSHFTGQLWNKGKTSYDDVRVKRRDINELLVENSGWTSDAIKKRLIKEGIKQYKCESCGLTTWGGYPIPLELHHKNGIHKDNRLDNLIILCPNCHAMTESFAKKKLSASDENQNVEPCKFEEPRSISQTGNLELSCQKTESVETRHREPKVSKEKEKRFCLYCGKELNSRQKNYCSQECSHLSKTQRPSYEEFIKTIAIYKTNVALSKYYSVSDKAIAKWKALYKIDTTVKE